MIKLPENIDEWLYSKGKYYLFEEYKDGKIIAKCKYHDRTSFMAGAGKYLCLSQIYLLTQGQTFTINSSYGTKYFFKWVDL